MHNNNHEMLVDLMEHLTQDSNDANLIDFDTITNFNSYFDYTGELQQDYTNQLENTKWKIQKASSEIGYLI